LKEQVKPCDLTLIFKGVERTHWSEQQGKNRVTYSGKSVITKVKYLLHSWTEPISPCDITVPFEFVSPTDIPETLQYLGSRSKRAVVEYYFKAILKNQDVKLMDKQNIYLAGAHAYDRIICQPKVAKLVSWCCFKKGEIGMNLRWINEIYVNGSPIECELMIDNTKCYSDIKAITAELYFSISVLSDSYRGSLFRERLMKSTYNVAVPSGQVLNESNPAKFKFDLSQTPKAGQFLNIHTSASQLITTNFFVDFYLETGLHCLCCGDKPVYSSIFIVRPLVNFQSTPAVELPQGWQPTVYGTVSLVYHPRDENCEKGETQNLSQYRSISKGNETHILESN
jgi:hypothetical protein